MKKIAVILFLVCITNTLFSQTNSISDFELIRLFKSENIKDPLLWSKESDCLALKIDKCWHKIRLNSIDIELSRWQGQEIGIVVNIDKIESITIWERLKFKFNTRIFKTTPFVEEQFNVDKTCKFMVRSYDIGDISSIIIDIDNTVTKTIWTGCSDCFLEYSLSPSKEYISFICSGSVFVVRIKNDIR